MQHVTTAAGDHDPFGYVTLGEAMAWLSQAPGFGCACIGGPRCCFRYTEQARRLQRAAHIVVKLLDTARALR